MFGLVTVQLLRFGVHFCSLLIIIISILKHIKIRSQWGPSEFHCLQEYFYNLL